MLKNKSKWKEPKKVQIKEDVIKLDPNFITDFLVLPPNGGWGWVVVAAASVSIFIIDGTTYTFGVFLEKLEQDFQPPSRVTLANSVLNALYFIMGPIACAMCNRMGFTIVGVVGGIISTLALIASSFVTDVNLYIFTYGVVLGIASSMSYIANILAVGFYFDSLRGIATAIAVFGSAVGTVAVGPIFKVALRNLTWRTDYLILAGGSAIVTLLAFCHKPIQPIRVVLEKDAPKVVPLDNTSLTSETSVSVMIRIHNQSYPTNYEIATNTNQAKLVKDQAGPSTSRTSFKSYNTWVTRKSNGSTLDLTTLHSEEGVKCCNSCRRSCNWLKFQRPMYKDDILYTASITTLPQYDRQRMKLNRSQASLDYHMSVTRVATYKDIEEGRKCCICCPEAVLRTLATMLDFSLLKKPSFFLLALSGFFTYVGILVPFVYVINYATSVGVEANMATYMLSTIGISNGVGRLCSGFLTMVPWMNALLITDIGLFMGAVAVALMVWFKEMTVLFACCAVFGFSVASVAALRPIIAVDMVGLERLTNAFGMIVLFEGVASFIGLPVAAMLKKTTGDYFWSFTFSAINIMLSMLCLLPIKPLMRFEEAWAERRERKERERRAEETRKKLAKINMPRK